MFLPCIIRHQALAGGGALSAALVLAITDRPALAIPCWLVGLALLIRFWMDARRPMTLPVSPGNAWCRVDEEGRIRAWLGDRGHFLASDTMPAAIAERLDERIDQGPAWRDLADHAVTWRQGDGGMIAVRIVRCRPRPDDGRDRWFHLRDITAEVIRQGALIESEAELRLVFDTIQDCVLLLDLDGTITAANTAARTRWGADLVGADAHTTVRQADDAGLEDALRACLAAFAPITREQHLPRQHRTVEASVCPIFNRRGRLRQLLYLERDITSQRMMELELQVQHRRLQESLVRLRELDQAKTAWLNSVSHELRTPLTSIRSASELLLTYPDTDCETRREFIEVIARECDRLTRLINDLLDLAAIESGSLHLQLEPVDLRSAVADTVTALQPLAKERGLRFDLGPDTAPLLLHSDRDRLTQVLVNLVSNAVKFSPDGGTIRIACWQADGEVHFTVEDQGPGIAPADRRRIFDRFTQINRGLTDKPTGTGLGLTISAEIMIQLGGLLRCGEPQQATGACFHGRLPQAGPTAPMAEDPSSPTVFDIGLAKTENPGV